MQSASSSTPTKVEKETSHRTNSSKSSKRWQRTKYDPLPCIPTAISCCPCCKSRIDKLEMMVNELFCYVSDYLPEEMDAFKRSAQEIYSPNWNCNEFQKEAKEVKGAQEESNKRHHKSKKKRYHISRPVRVVAPDMERHPRRREFTFDEKKEFVTRVQEAVKRGQKIGLVCEQLGICDRSYQRWKKAIEEGKEIQQLSQGDILIGNFDF